VCMDGTWSRLNTDTPTNIAKLARSVDHECANPRFHGGQNVKQIVIYTQGVGAASDYAADAKGAIAGGLFAAGLEDDILATYIRLCLNYEWGDEIYIFGYSRGAFSARSLGGLIRRCGILRRRHVDQAREAFRLYRNGRYSKKHEDPAKRGKPWDVDDVEFKTFRLKYGKNSSEGEPPKIRFYGLFDTVGQRGMPSGLGPLTEWMNDKYAFHSTNLGKNVEAARHAMAIDEARFVFPPSLWTNLDDLNEEARAIAEAAGQPFNPANPPYQQRWFPGTHGDVGGGAGGAKLANFALAWVAEGAEDMGLKFDRTPGAPIHFALLPENLDAAAPLVAPKAAKGLRPRQLPMTPDDAKAAMVFRWPWR
jgi:uncharacterized protein (DUF2235 family)